MTWLLVAGGWWIGGAVAAWLLRRRPGVATILAIPATVIGSACLFAAAFSGLSGMRVITRFSWSLPFGDAALRLDPLSGVFLCPIALIGSCAAIFAPGYLRLRGHGGAIGSWLAAFMLLLANMALVLVAANTVLFLAAWEGMTILSWYLLTDHHEEGEVRAAGIGYLIAGHVSGMALLLLFVFLAPAGKAWAVPEAPPSLFLPPTGAPPAILLFLLVLVGFGTKAALVPFHVWLPDAHASAPSPISALMSGVLITLGFYGLLRFLPAIGIAPVVAGATLMVLGAVGACGGIVMALSQRDVKRVLAYSTVENAGLVTLAIGAAFLAQGRAVAAALAWSAALLHIWNHAVSKSLLFLSGGAVAELTGSRDLESWGGLWRRMPVLAAALLIGAAALIGLPGTHGFASEWLLFMGLFTASLELTGLVRLAMLCGVMALAFSAGTALGCFVRLLGIGLLGHPRSPGARNAGDPRSFLLWVPVLALAVLCIVLTVLAKPLLALLAPAVHSLAPEAEMTRVIALAAPLPWIAAALAVGAGIVVLGRWWLDRSRTVRWAVTWDCGYARPAADMQYTATSLAEPIKRVFQPALRTLVHWTAPRSLWPAALSWEDETPERTAGELYRPAYHRLVQALGFLTRLQEGRVMAYLRYVAIALLVLLGWLFVPAGSLR